MDPNRLSLTLWDLPKLTWRVAQFMEEKEVFAMMQVSRRLYTLMTHDNVWREMLVRYNLNALMQVTSREVLAEKSLHAFFTEDIMTSKVMCGRYGFEADEDNFVFNIQQVIFIVSPASFGNTSHSVGRGQLLITYRNTAEVLQGSLRFSPHLKSFVLSCNTFGSNQRGPVFMVAVAQANKKWANQCPKMFSAHRGGLRLVMTPMIIEGITKGSQMTEAEIIGVSRPPPPGVVIPMLVSQQPQTSSNPPLTRKSGLL